MTQDLDVLRDLIADDALVHPTDDSHGKSELVLEEPGSPTTSEETGPPVAYSLKIRHVPDDVLAIRAYLFPKPTFRGTRGERRRADFIIVASGAKKWIIYVELKGGKKRKGEIEQQLNGAKCLLGYCRAVGQTFWRRARFLSEKQYNQRFVSVTRLSISKKTTRPKRHRNGPSVHDTAENMLRISSPAKNTVPFGRLVGGDAEVA